MRIPFETRSLQSSLSRTRPKKNKTKDVDGTLQANYCSHCGTCLKDKRAGSFDPIRSANNFDLFYSGLYGLIFRPLDQCLNPLRQKQTSKLDSSRRSSGPLNANPPSLAGATSLAGGYVVKNRYGPSEKSFIDSKTFFIVRIY